MNLYKDTREEDRIVVENGSLKPRKTTGIYKAFGKTVNEVWSEAFLNYMLVINILFGTPELSAALLLFYRQIMTLARLVKGSPSSGIRMAQVCGHSPLSGSFQMENRTRLPSQLL